MLAHVYKCESCCVDFAVDQNFEDQSVIVCPVCGKEDKLLDLYSALVMVQK